MTGVQTSSNSCWVCPVPQVLSIGRRLRWFHSLLFKTNSTIRSDCFVTDTPHVPCLDSQVQCELLAEDQEADCWTGSVLPPWCRAQRWPGRGRFPGGSCSRLRTRSECHFCHILVSSVARARSQVLRFGGAKYIFRGERFRVCYMFKNSFGHNKIWEAQKFLGKHWPRMDSVANAVLCFCFAVTNLWTRKMQV